MYQEGEFTTGVRVAITNGTRQVTFDTPSDFSDWLDWESPGNLAGWQWVVP